jgi:hypothetical protein
MIQVPFLPAVTNMLPYYRAVVSVVGIEYSQTQAIRSVMLLSELNYLAFFSPFICTETPIWHKFFSHTGVRTEYTAMRLSSQNNPEY